MEQISNKMLEMKVKMMLMVSGVLTDESGSEFNDGGSTNWARNIAIGFAIAAVLFLAVKAFMPEILDAWKAKILEMFK